jgi:hypothetical protein
MGRVSEEHGGLHGNKKRAYSCKGSSSAKAFCGQGFGFNSVPLAPGQRQLK